MSTVDKTKRAIAESLKHLLLKKSIAKITISEIMAETGMSRMTFYYHYKDIYDLIEWICIEDAMSAVNGKLTADNWQQGLALLLKTVRDNRELVLRLYFAMDQVQLERCLTRITERLMTALIGEEAISQEKRYTVNFYMFGIVGVMMEWIRDGMRETPEHIAALVADIVRLDLIQD